MNAPQAPQNDPDAWPPELCELWERCSLPSLHAFLEAEERLAMEIRRQNRELRALGERIDAADTTAEPREAQERAEPALVPLFALADAVERLETGLRQTIATIDKTIPRRSFPLFRRPRWRPQVLERCRAQREGAEMIGDRMRDLFDSMGVVRLAPTAGDPFDPTCHRAVATTVAPPEMEITPPGAVVQLLRPGYRRGRTVLRPAEVSVATKAGI